MTERQRELARLIWKRSMKYVFDLETDGLLRDVTKVHCISLRNIETDEQFDFADQPGYRPLSEGFAMINAASVLIGHNAIGYDIPVLRKLGMWAPMKGLVVRDTMVLAQLLNPNIKEHDYKRKDFPKYLAGRHSLEAWGHRIGTYKGDYKGGWDAWSPEMHEYMIQDTKVTQFLWERCVLRTKDWGLDILTDDPAPGKDCIALEHRVAEIVQKVEQAGFRFNVEAAMKLCEQLHAKRQALTDELKDVFPPRCVKTEFIPKVNNKARGYVKGVPFVKEKWIPFNPGSRQEVGRRLQGLGWKPSAFTTDGHATINDEILKSLPYPQAQRLAEFYLLDKRIGQIADGKEGWFKHVRNGRIHGRINSVGAHTGRMSHSSPNIAQVPKVGSAYGAECRSCFLADEGMTLVGCDADGLELRDLAGYMALYDGGAYIETVLRGDKSKGTDMHTMNAKLWQASRDDAKVGFYALIYGAGDVKLAESLGHNVSKMKYNQAKALGEKLRKRIMTGLPALGKLVERVGIRLQQAGFLVGLDGRRLFARSDNAALNTLLQSAGAVQMKRALVILYDDCIAKGWKWGVDYTIHALVHDEFQASVKPELADEYGTTAAQSIKKAGEFYNFRCPLAGNYDKGKNWNDSH